MDEAEEQATCGNQQPRGTLRVTVPAAFGRLHIAPLVPEFLSRYPELKLSLHLSDSLVDIVNDGYDVAVRIGELKDSSLIARVLGQDRRVVVTTPSYLKQHGTPQTPQQLSEYSALLFSNSVHLDQWQFIDGEGKTETVKVNGNLKTNNCDALHEAIYADACYRKRPVYLLSYYKIGLGKYPIGMSWYSRKIESCRVGTPLCPRVDYIPKPYTDNRR